MIKLNEDMLINDLCSTAIELSGGANNNFINNNYLNFVLLNEYLYHNFGKVILYNKCFSEEQFVNLLYKKECQSLFKFVTFLNDNNDDLLKLSSSFLKHLKKIDFKEYPYWDNLRGYSEKDFKDIILGYYSTYGNELYSHVKKYFDEKRINLGTINDRSGYAGFFVGLQWIDSGYIFSIYNAFNSATASALVHELGHAIDAERFVFPQKKNIPVFSDVLCEVPSTTFELGFLDYLKSNRIDIDGSMILKNNRICDMQDYFDAIKKVTKDTDDFEVCSDGIAEDKDGNEYDLRDSVLYGLGYYYALHLNLIQSKDPKEFLKVFNNIVTMRKESSFRDSVDMMGYNYNEFLSGSYIKPILKNDMLELKKRYKY